MKLQQFARRSIAPALTVLAVFAAGCTTVVISGGPGAYTYAGGKAVGAEEVSLDQAWNAVQIATRELQLKETSSGKDINSGHLYSVTADGTTVKMYVTRRGDKLTEIAVRYGVFGDELASRAIYDHITAHLKDPLPQPSTPPPIELSK